MVIKKNFLFPVGLRELLFVAFTAVAIAPVFLLSYWIQQTLMESEVRAVEEKHVMVSRNTASALSHYAKTIESSFLTLSKNEVGTLSPSTQELLTAQHIDLIIKLKGSQLTFNLGDATLLPKEGITKVIQSFGTEFNNVEAGESKIIASPVLLNRLQRPMVYFLMRNSADGYLIGAINTEFFNQLQASVTFGNAGFAAIFDKLGGSAIQSQEQTPGYIRRIQKWIPIQEMQVADSGVTQYYSPILKTEMIAGYTKLEAFGWGVIVSQPFYELEEKTHLNMMPVYIVAGLILLIALFVCWKITGLIVKPISSVIYAANEVASSKHVNHIRANTIFAPKEITQLITVFDQMAEKVELGREKLEQRVEERTRELQVEIKDRKKLQEKLVKMANHDELTKLPNRRLLKEQLKVALLKQPRQQGMTSVLFIDLDGFKLVNDTYGHQVGDELLAQVARRINYAVRTSDSVYRYGGDEFVVLIEDAMTEKDIRIVADKILMALKSVFNIGHEQIFIGGSIGIRIAQNSDTDVGAFLKDADMAMYKAKKKRNDIVIFGNEINQKGSCVIECQFGR